MVTAELNNYRQSPRKVRLVADTVRGKKVSVALTTLSFVPKRAADPVKKLIESAVANAKHNFKLNPEDLYIKSIVVDPGLVMKRWMPKWRGTAHPIRKRTSHVKVVLATRDGVVVADAQSTEEAAPKAVKKPAVKKAAAKSTTKKVTK